VGSNRDGKKEVPDRKRERPREKDESEYSLFSLSCVNKSPELVYWGRGEGRRWEGYGKKGEALRGRNSSGRGSGELALQ